VRAHSSVCVTRLDPTDRLADWKSLLSDHLGSYIQSRSYRAPEVILGCPYDQRIDLWSLGCILAELYTGQVLFENQSVPSLLSRMISILGPFDVPLLRQGRLSRHYFTRNNQLYERHESQLSDGTVRVTAQVLRPPVSSLDAQLVGCESTSFLSLLSALLSQDPERRPTAAQALHHPFLHEL
jgi:serine/threonine protein kinase